ncbi:MAG: PASTA domain-containing protein [Ferruginibacter sp.]
MFTFITSRSIWVNLLAALALGILIVFIILQLLGWITKHGEYLTVPTVTGKNTQEAIKFLEDKGFEVIIQDSIFTDTAKRGTVLKQLPDANSTVKVNRSVFITVNRYVPPMIIMPQLEGKNLSYAMDILQRSHLLLGDTTYRVDFMKGSVLEQLFDGNRVAAGAPVRWGSRISLVIGSGLDDTNLVVPDFTGMTYGEAKAQLDTLGILISPVLDAGVTDTLSAFIYRQNPPHFDEQNKLVYIKPGMVMDLWLSKEMIYTKDSLNSNK